VSSFRRSFVNNESDSIYIFILIIYMFIINNHKFNINIIIEITIINECFFYVCLGYDSVIVEGRPQI